MNGLSATSMAKIEFIFVDLVDKRCQVPSNKLIRDAFAIFVVYDKDKDGLIYVGRVEYDHEALGLNWALIAHYLLCSAGLVVAL